MKRLNLKKAIPYWFGEDLTVYVSTFQLKISKSGSLAALPGSQVENGNKYLKLLKEAKTYSDAQEVFNEYISDINAPKLIPIILNVKENFEYLFEVWAYDQGFSLEEKNNLPFDKQPTNTYLFEYIKNKSFNLANSNLYRDESGSIICTRDFQLWTDKWIPLEISQSIGKPDLNYGIDYNPAEYIYENLDDFIKVFNNSGFKLKIDDIEFEELAWFGII